jgi:hypothetical protein
MTGAMTGPSLGVEEECAMSSIRRRRWVAGLILGLGPAATSRAQDLPPALPEGPLPVPSAPVAEATPIYRPSPVPVLVPPGGFRPTWYPPPIDPIALKRHEAHHAEHKSRSRLWRCLQGKLWGYPEAFEPRPLGASLYENGLAMAANGAAARMTLYRFDFKPDSSELSPRGVDQLAKITAQLAVSPFPVIVERTPNEPALAESRRYAVLAQLARGPVPVPSDRVLIGVPKPIGLTGSDAQVIAGNSLGRTQGYGPPIPINSNGVNSPSGVTSSSGAASNGGINP